MLSLHKIAKPLNNKQLRSQHKLSWRKLLIFGLIFAVIGAVLFITYATAPFASIEAEVGTISGSASKVSSATASGGSFVTFGQVTTVDPVIVAAGDIACDPTDPFFAGNATHCQQRATAQLLTNLNPSAVLTLGDNQYESGTLTNFTASFSPSWGTSKPKIHPAIGNHEGGEGGSNAGYFDYFDGIGAQTGSAGDRSKGYYSYNIGSWHLIALNSNCGTYLFNGSTTGCATGSPQETWLKSDLAGHTNACTLAYWHVPRFSSGNTHHNDAATDTVYTAIWNDLYAAGADVVLNGHDHDYERFQALSPNGTINTAKGITEFVVGTGGRDLYLFSTVVNGSVIRADGFGVLKLTLHSNGYDWQFVNAPGSNIIDSGTAQCHP